MMVDYRPVDCGSYEPIDFLPGSIGDLIYKDGPRTGWAWFANEASPCCQAASSPSAGLAGTCFVCNIKVGCGGMGFNLTSLLQEGPLM